MACAIIVCSGGYCGVLSILPPLFVFCFVALGFSEFLQVVVFTGALPHLSFNHSLVSSSAAVLLLPVGFTVIISPLYLHWLLVSWPWIVLGLLSMVMEPVLQVRWAKEPLEAFHNSEGYSTASAWHPMGFSWQPSAVWHGPWGEEH